MKKNPMKLKRLLLMLELVIFGGLSVWAQERNVSGKVSDALGNPLPGVSVVIKGTTVGTITSMDGEYNLQVEDGKTIVFSFIGMVPQEIVYTGQTIINIEMEDETIGMDEVVVVGYGVQQKKTLTGAVGSVKSDDLVQRPATNSTQLLQGQVAGLATRQSTGLPGADGTTLNIRGYGGEPLVLVDGMESSLGVVDPNDIESISVLKDASAAIYGARAGNGVVLVTTKRGSAKETQISYHGNMSFAQPTFLPEHVNATQMAEMMHEAGIEITDEIMPSYLEYDADANEVINTMDGSVFKGYNWSKALMRDWTPQQQHNISANGGSEKVKYYVSLGFTDQESNFASGDYDYDRYNLRSNLDAQITDNLSVSTSFSYTKTILDKANFSTSDMYIALGTASPFYPSVHEADPTRATYSGFMSRSPYSQTFKEFSGFYKRNVARLLGNFELRYDFPMVKGLSATAKLAYEDVYTDTKDVSQPFDVWDYDPRFAGEEDAWIFQGTKNANTISVSYYKVTELLPTFSLKYERSIGDHNIKTLLASETRVYDTHYLQGSAKDLVSFSAPYLDYASDEGVENSEVEENEARSSVIGRINYDYKGKYMFEFAMRADASAEYPPEGRWGYFPSFSGGWRLSEESFIKDNMPNVNNLKLRASFGILGNDKTSSFDYLTGYEIPGNTYVFGTTEPESVKYIESAGIANPNVTWETMTMYNAGLDATLWNGLFGFELDVFYRLRDDILAYSTATVPTTFGGDVEDIMPKTNLNATDNRGFEILLTHKNRIGEFSYSVSPSFSWTKSKNVRVDEDVSDDPDWNARYVTEGRERWERWGYLSDGVFETQEEIDNHTVDQDSDWNSSLVIGDIKYKDLNGDNVIDYKDQRVIGRGATYDSDTDYVLPNINYGLKLDFQYKGVGLNMLFQGAADYLVEFSGSAAAPFVSNSVPLTYQYDNRMIVGIDENGNEYITNPDAALPPLNTVGDRTANNSKNSDFWWYNAHYFRLKNVNLSYTLPKRIVKEVGITNCTFYMAGTNLWTVSNLGIFKDSYDPEVVKQNARDYPPVKTITVGLRLTL